MPYTYRDAASQTGYSVRHLKRLLGCRGANLPSHRTPGDVVQFDERVFNEWWEGHRAQPGKRLENLGPYGRRATDRNGKQVCPGRDQLRCGAELPRKANGLMARLCVGCEAAHRAHRARFGGRRAAR
jgi:hypothetical protein